MNRPWIQIERYRYEDDLGHFQVTASDGLRVAAQEFYGDIEDLRTFGKRLAAFPTAPSVEVAFEAGRKDPGWAHWLLVRAYLHDRAGRAALLIEASTNGVDPWASASRFTIRCEVASLNRLGTTITAWNGQEETSLREELSPWE
jgi:hypothetical protein